MKATTLVNGDRYRAMITNFFIPELNNHDVQELWFQQDGATCHTARATIDLLKDTFVTSFLGKGKKADLIKLAIELGECESNGEELKIIELRTKILTNDAYKEDLEFEKCIFEEIVSNRIDEENKRNEEKLSKFELQKIRLQNETQRVIGPQTLPQTKIELKELLPTFNPEVDNMDLFLTLFEWQMKLLDLGEDLWVPYLIGALPSDVSSFIAREPEEMQGLLPHLRNASATVQINHRKILGAVFTSQKKPKWDVEGLLF
ncbi:uncharacterized protein TNCV_1987421 [Trichonephila clavipes]|nr:uncharacterized protein TNCV_1987421 [Trichonephila clavipes]